MTNKIYTFGLKGKPLGTVRTYGAAKKLQLDSLPEDLKEYYGGIQDGYPVFHPMPDDLALKYNIDQ